MLFVRSFRKIKAAGDHMTPGSAPVLSFARKDLYTFRMEFLYTFPVEILYTFPMEFLYTFPVEILYTFAMEICAPFRGITNEMMQKKY